MGMKSYEKFTWRGDSVDSGSLLPFMLFIFMLALTIYGFSVNLFALQNSKISLERWGEEMLSDIYQNIAYADYYFKEVTNPVNNSRKFIPVDCLDLHTAFTRAGLEFPEVIDVVSFSCNSGIVELAISKRVKLPFLPPALSNFEPKVQVYIKGGLQQVSNS